MDATLRPYGIFPAGTSVKAYPRSNWAPHQQPPQGDPVGAETDTANVAADGTLDFTGLDADTDYVAYAEIGGVDRYIQFRTDAEAVVSGGGGGGSTTADFSDYDDAVIDVATLGPNTIIAAPGAGNRIRVMSYRLIVDGPTQIDFLSAAAVVEGPLDLIANGGLSPSGGSGPMFSCGENEALRIQSSAAVQQSGSVSYIIEAV